MFDQTVFDQTLMELEKSAFILVGFVQIFMDHGTQKTLFRSFKNNLTAVKRF